MASKEEDFDDEGDVELSLVDRKNTNKDFKKMKKSGGTRGKLKACFTCEALCLVILDFAFCWPRYLCESICKSCPKVDCCKCFGCFPTCKCNDCCPPNLRTINIVAGFWHLLLTIFGAVGFFIQSSTDAGKSRLFQVNLDWEFPERNFTNSAYQTTAIKNFLNNTCMQEDGSMTCPGQNVNEDFFTWSSCARRNSTNTMVNDAFRLATPVKRYEETFNGEFYVVYLVIAFSAITSFAHFSIGTCLYDYYITELKQFRQPLRWLEYSITASVMMVIVLLLCNMTNAFILGASLLLTMSYNSFGAAMEYPSVKLWAVRCWFYIISTLGFAYTFFIAFMFYYRAIIPWLELVDDGYTCSAWGDLFGFVGIVVWSLFISYLTFPLNDTIKHVFLCCTERGCCGQDENEAFMSLDEPDEDVNCCMRCFYKEHKGVRGQDLHEKRRQDCYLFFEFCYIMLSFFSKTILVAIVMSSALMRGAD